jgi:hypothetical protein
MWVRPVKATQAHGMCWCVVLGMGLSPINSQARQQPTQGMQYAELHAWAAWLLVKRLKMLLVYSVHEMVTMPCGILSRRPRVKLSTRAQRKVGGSGYHNQQPAALCRPAQSSITDLVTVLGTMVCY